MKLFRRTAIAALFAAVCNPAAAQWQTPTHSVPLGQGVGITGFGYAAPGGAGGVLTSNGSTADPSFQSPAGSASITPLTTTVPGGTAGNVLGVTTSGCNSGSPCLSQLGTLVQIFASPSAIGGTTPAAGSFSTLTSTGTTNLGGPGATTINSSVSYNTILDGKTGSAGHSDPVLVLLNNDTVTPSGAGGSIYFDSPNSSAVNKSGVVWNAGLIDATAGSEYGTSELHVIVTGVDKNAFIVNGDNGRPAYFPGDDALWDLGLISGVDGATITRRYQSLNLASNVNALGANFRVTGVVANAGTYTYLGAGGGAGNQYICFTNGTGVLTANATCGVSDAGLKNVTATISPQAGLNEIMQLRPVHFDWLDAKEAANSGHQIGLIAQEVASVIPEAAKTDKTTQHITLASGEVREIKDPMSVDYAKLVSPLIAAVQALAYGLALLFLMLVATFILLLSSMRRA